MRDRPKAGQAAPGAGGSIKHVAARAGVSIATVSRVMNGVANKASPGTAARVRDAAASLDYRPISAGRALRSRQSRMVAVLAANLANPTMAAIAASAEAALRQAGFVMVLCDTHDRPDLQDEYLREMRARQAHAIVLLGAVRSPLLLQLAASGERLVFVNRREPYGRPAPFVGIDNAAAAEEVAEACLRLGLRRVAIVHGSRASSATEDRLKSLQKAFAGGGHRAPAARLLTLDSADHLSIGFQSGRTLLKKGLALDAVIALSDLIAFGIHRAFAEQGLARQPRLFGFDDNPLNGWIAPWLSSVRIPYADFGPAIADLIAEAPDSGARRQIVLPHQLVIRADAASQQK